MFKVEDWKILKHTGLMKRNMIVLTYHIHIEDSEDKLIEYVKPIKSVLCIDTLIDFNVQNSFGGSNYNVNLNFEGSKQILHFGSVDKVSGFTKDLAGFLTFDIQDEIMKPIVKKITSKIEVPKEITSKKIVEAPSSVIKKNIKGLAKKYAKYKIKKTKLKTPQPPKEPKTSLATPVKTPPVTSPITVSIDKKELFSSYDNTKFPKDTAKIVSFK